MIYESYLKYIKLRYTMKYEIQIILCSILTPNIPEEVHDLCSKVFPT